MSVKNILNKEDLMEIAEFFMEKGYGNNVHIEIELPDKSTLEKVNEDFFYRLNADNKEALQTNIDDVNINVGGVKFRYFVKEK